MRSFALALVWSALVFALLVNAGNQSCANKKHELFSKLPSNRCKVVPHKKNHHQKEQVQIEVVVVEIESTLVFSEAITKTIIIEEEVNSHKHLTSVRKSSMKSSAKVTTTSALTTSTTSPTSPASTTSTTSVPTLLSSSKSPATLVTSLTSSPLKPVSVSSTTSALSLSFISIFSTSLSNVISPPSAFSSIKASSVTTVVPHPSSSSATSPVSHLISHPISVLSSSLISVSSFSHISRSHVTTSTRISVRSVAVTSSRIVSIPNSSVTTDLVFCNCATTPPPAPNPACTTASYFVQIPEFDVPCVPSSCLQTGCVTFTEAPPPPTGYSRGDKAFAAFLSDYVLADCMAWCGLFQGCVSFEMYEEASGRFSICNLYSSPFGPGSPVIASYLPSYVQEYNLIDLVTIPSNLYFSTYSTCRMISTSFSLLPTSTPISTAVVAMPPSISSFVTPTVSVSSTVSYPSFSSYYSSSIM